jgi:hypothetical protein
MRGSTMPAARSPDATAARGPCRRGGGRRPGTHRDPHARSNRRGRVGAPAPRLRPDRGDRHGGRVPPSWRSRVRPEGPAPNFIPAPRRAARG